MQDSTGPKGNKEQNDAGGDSEATSKETLSDVEENEADADGSELDPGPSPDGAFDESGENKDAGPM